MISFNELNIKIGEGLMYSNIYDFFLNNIEKSEEEKNMIHEMVDIMDIDQLSKVIDFLKESYLKKIKTIFEGGICSLLLNLRNFYFFYN